MLQTALKALFGSRNDRLLKTYRKRVEQINALEPEFQKLTDEQLQAKTPELKKRVADGATLDDILPEAFATVREAGKRILGMRHFDVQLVGGMALHEGKIAEMRTGEGKTLVATLPSYLNALTGKGVHVVTVNDYLAKRDAEWMGRIHRFLGMSVGVVIPQMDAQDKQAAYQSDITYGTNNEFGFDYLRDNMATQVGERFQRGLNFAIVDEVDSILIDEARTPLIISGQAEDSTELYRRINVLIPKLKPQPEEKAPGDYWVDLKQHSVTLSEEGHEHAEQLMNEAGLLPEGASLYDPANIILMHHLYAGVRAHSLYHRDQHYVVQDDEVVIVDEFTGRMMQGRRWSEGLHQAVEAKEGTSIKNESQTLASITFQNYFRLYKKLSGMTGTADTEAFEFSHIYNLETVLIPTHRKMVRKDSNDQVFITAKEKYAAIITDVKDCYARGQPVLLGTTSIENSELIATLLEKEGLPHQVLNAKQHAREADIVTQAGRPKMVTIATNMAGRGTDIVLGGNPDPEIQLIKTDEALNDSEKDAKVAAVRANWDRLHAEVVAAGGLHIVGSERHESRRIDNQLRGRAARQGDPGSSRFYLSFEDPLLKIFAGEKLKAVMGALKIPEGEAIEAKIVTRSIENAQRKVEARNFDIRKQLLEYDDVASDQRKVIYAQRNELLESQDISQTIASIRSGVLGDTVVEHMPADSVEEQWDIAGLERKLESDFYTKAPVADWVKADETLDGPKVAERVIEASAKAYADKFTNIDAEVVHHYERAVMLQSIDTHWREHLAALDYLRQGIHLRGYAQKQPKQEYKREAFELFGAMLDSIKRDVTRHLMGVQIRSQEQVEEAERRAEEASRVVKNVQYNHPGAETALADEGDVAIAEAPPPQAMGDAAPFVRSTNKVGRNDPCPCGSGKKYKQCHGKLG
ncbi:Protein translocase subunit SecA [Usitatibacter rugosus]|uniref:Protein translocase subunit SecA n=1 Tax=Usitatibacter rugosus TaxID=2732067 RepID=A0A6M4GRE0_9PROT|nr:preprotein translocase subunit SecA [Usitatibacter rugosus]QJR09646.1 Protein translocase subunit SecA [Usitatibacter rugosus]